MAGKKLELGDTGRAVAANVERLRGNENYTDLSRRLDKLGRDIPPLALRRIEEGARRVDTDDLVALAVALGVSPITLIMPHTENSQDEVEVTRENKSVSALALWRWLLAELPMQGDKRIPLAFQIAARPTWWWQYQAEKEERDHLERRAADRNLIESGLMSADDLLNEGKSSGGND